MLANEFPFLENQNISLRPFMPKDIEMIFILRSSPLAMEYMDRDLFRHKKEAQTFVENSEKAFQNKTGINWIIQKKGQETGIGYIGFWRLIPEHYRAEIGYALLPEYWKQGIMSQAMDLCVSYGFEKMKLHSIEANINPNNTASAVLLKKAGFRKEALFRENFFHGGVFKDSEIYSLLEKYRNQD